MTYNNAKPSGRANRPSDNARRHGSSNGRFRPDLARADLARPAALAAIVREHVKWSRAEGKYDRVGVEPPVNGHRFNECLLRVAEILERHERLSSELHRASAEIARLRTGASNASHRGRNKPTKRNDNRKETERK